MSGIITFFGFIAIAAGIAVAVRHVFNEFTSKVTVRDYESALHYKDGRYLEKLEAGKHRFWGSGHEVVIRDTRRAQMIVQGQELMTADKAPLKVTAVASYRVVDALKFVECAYDAQVLLYTWVQLALRDVIGAETADDVIENKTGYGEKLVEKVREVADLTGIEFERIDIRDVMLGGDLKRVYAGVIHARKEAEAGLERARGEAAALRTLANASRLFQNNPELLQLKYLQTLGEAGEGMGNTFVMGLPDWLTSTAVKK